jgi:hypothetical protein
MLNWRMMTADCERVQGLVWAISFAWKHQLGDLLGSYYGRMLIAASSCIGDL